MPKKNKVDYANFRIKSSILPKAMDCAIHCLRPYQTYSENGKQIKMEIWGLGKIFEATRQSLFFGQIAHLSKNHDFMLLNTVVIVAEVYKRVINQGERSVNKI